MISKRTKFINLNVKYSHALEDLQFELMNIAKKI